MADSNAPQPDFWSRLSSAGLSVLQGSVVAPLTTGLQKAYAGGVNILQAKTADVAGRIASTTNPAPLAPSQLALQKTTPVQANAQTKSKVMLYALIGGAILLALFLWKDR